VASNPAWKQFERRVAGLFSTARAPLSGGNSRHTRSDSLHPNLFISCKYSKKSSLHTLYDEENKKAEEEDKMTVLCTMKANAKYFLVTVANTDLVEFCMKYLRSKGYIIIKGPNARDD